MFLFTVQVIILHCDLRTQGIISFWARLLIFDLCPRFFRILSSRFELKMENEIETLLDKGSCLLKLTVTGKVADLPGINKFRKKVKREIAFLQTVMPWSELVGIHSWIFSSFYKLLFSDSIQNPRIRRVYQMFKSTSSRIVDHASI